MNAKSLSMVIAFFCFLIVIGNVFSYEDYSHYSEVFGEQRMYRVFFPEDYTSSGQRYPVVYYFHGHSPRYNNALYGYEDEIENNLIKTGPVILVAWDGRVDPSQGRAYNYGLHEHVKYEVQFHDYFIELVEHVDNTFRTINNRENRAVIGHSMGGLMAFLLAGKLPHMICAAVNMFGSPEFFVGYPENHTFLRLSHYFRSLYGVHLRFQNSTSGELAYLNSEVHAGAVREKNLSYEYKIYPGGHSFDFTRFKEGFEFLVAALNDPLPQPDRWHCADLYDDFNVWGYEVSSNKQVPGYIEMRGVTEGGMGIKTTAWLPYGPLIPEVEINVKTAPIYEPNAAYTFLDYNVTRDTKNMSTITSDAEGKISFSLNHEEHQFGIYNSAVNPEMVLLAHEIDGESKFLPFGKEALLKIRVLNRGGGGGSGVTASLSTTTDNVLIIEPDIEVGDVSSGEAVWPQNGWRIAVSNNPPLDASPFRVRFNVLFRDNQNAEWEDEFDVPVLFDVPQFENIQIDDGRNVSADYPVLGSGNGNGNADPGEKIMIYANNHRLRLYYDDPCIEKQEEALYDDFLPSIWLDGITLSSIIHIRDDCAGGRPVLLANYETKEYDTMKRTVHWGLVNLDLGEVSDIHESQSKNAGKVKVSLSPLNGEMIISSDFLSHARRINFAIYDVNAVRIASLALHPESGSCQWKLNVPHLRVFDTGVCFYSITADEKEYSGKIVLIK
jgi:enterochelin esterase-like enzyme